MSYNQQKFPCRLHNSCKPAQPFLPSFELPKLPHIVAPFGPRSWTLCWASNVRGDSHLLAFQACSNRHYGGLPVCWHLLLHPPPVCGSILLHSWAQRMSGRYLHSSVCWAIGCSCRHRIFESAIEVCHHRFQVPGFHLLNGVEKTLIKLIYDHLETKPNVRTLILWLIWKASSGIVKIGWILSERYLKIKKEWVINESLKRLLMKYLIILKK